MLYLIVTKPAPTLQGAKWSSNFKDFIAKTLNKDPELRHDAESLLKHPFLANAEQYREEFKQFIAFWKEKEKLEK